MPTLTAPYCRIDRVTPPRSYRVLLDRPDKVMPLTVELFAATAADAMLTAIELAGPGAKVRCCWVAGEW